MKTILFLNLAARMTNQIIHWRNFSHNSELHELLEIYFHNIPLNNFPLTYQYVMNRIMDRSRTLTINIILLANFFNLNVSLFDSSNILRITHTSIDGNPILTLRLVQYNNDFYNRDHFWAAQSLLLLSRSN